MAKRIEIFASMRDSERILFLASGIYFNKAVERLKVGDTVTIAGGWLRDDVRIVRKCKARRGTSAFNFLFEHAYAGRRGFTFEDWIRESQEAAVREGHSKDSFDLDEITIVEVERINSLDIDG